MADKSIDDLDVGMDDFEFQDFDFGGPSSLPPPKNKREALTRTAGDISKGFKSGFTDHKLKSLGKITESAIPNKLSTEYLTLKDSASNIKGILDKSIDDFKKEAGKTTKTLSKLFPEGKIGNWLKKINEKLEDNANNDKYDKQKAQDEEIQQGILASLGEMKEKQHQDALIQAALQNKQHATSIEMLRLIYAENKLMRNFQFEITNKYYRKSLELQFKSLYINREMLELQKLQFTTFKNQFETIVLNTSLPDVIKSRNNEKFKETLHSRMRDSMVNSLFKTMAPLGGFNKNLEKKIQNSITGFLGGLTNANNALEMAVGAQDMLGDFGMTKSYLVGEQLSDFTKNYIGKKAGDLIYKRSKRFRQGVANIKDFTSDTRTGFRKLANSKQKGWLGKTLRFLGNQGVSLTDSNVINRANFGQAALDESMIFDGRAHGALTKVIPGLLSKIYGEIKATRIGLKIQGGGSDHEIHYDYKVQGFLTNKQLASNLKADFKREIDNNTKYAANKLTETLKTANINLTGQKAEIFARAITSYMMQPNAVMNSQTIIDPSFLSTIQDPSIVKMITRNRNNYLKAIRDDDWFQQDIINGINSVRSSMPNMSKRFEELFRSGHGNLLSSLGVASYDKVSGNYLQDDAGLKNLFMNMYDSKTTDKLTDSELKKIRERQFGINESNLKSSRVKHEESKSTVDKLISKVKKKKTTEVETAIENLDKESLTNYVIDNKTKLEELIPEIKNNKTNTRYRDRLKRIQKKFKTQYNKIKKRYNNALSPAAQTEYSNKLEDMSNQINVFVAEVKDKGSVSTAMEVKYTKKIDDIYKDSIQIDRTIAMADKNVITQTGKIDNSTTSYNENKVSANNKGKRNTKNNKVDVNELNSTGRKILKHFEARDMEDLKDEYFASKEYKQGKVSNFMAWVRDMGYSIRGEDKTLLKRVLRKTRAWDRKMFFGIHKAIFGAPFRAIGSIFGLRESGPLLKGVGLGAKAGSTVATKMFSTMADMLPFGMGHLVKAPFLLMNKTLELAGLKEKEEEKKNRKGGWLSRIKNMFSRNDKKEDNKEKKGFFANMNGLQKAGVGIGILGILGMMKDMNINLQDIYGGIKTVGSYLIKGFQFISNIIGWVWDRVPDWLKPNGNKKQKSFQRDPNTGEILRDPDGNPIEDEKNIAEKTRDAVYTWGAIAGGTGLLFGRGLKGKAALTWKLAKAPITLAKNTTKLGIKGAGMAIEAIKAAGGSTSAITNVAEQATKVAKPGLGTRIMEIFKTGKKWLTGSIGNFITKNIGRVKSAVDVMIKMFSSSKSVMKKIGNAAFKKGGAKLAGKATLQISKFVAKVLSGVGLLLIVWDIAWIIYYYLNDRSFWGAVTEQLLGVNLLDDIEDSGSESKEENESRIHKGKSYKNEDGSVSFGGSVSAAIESFSSTYSKHRSQGAGYWESIKGASGAAISGWQTGDVTTVERSVADRIKEYVDAGGANLDNLQPITKVKLANLAEDYYNKYNKKLKINSGARTYVEQKRLYDTKPKGVAANPDNPGKIPPHMAGVALDINTPDANKMEESGMLSKNGWYRPVYDKTKPQSKSESWHIEIEGTRSPAEMRAGRMIYGPVTSSHMANIEKENESIRERIKLSAGSGMKDLDSGVDTGEQGIEINNRVTRQDDNGTYQSYNVTANPELKALNDANKRARGNLISASDSLSSQATARTASYSPSSASNIKPISTTMNDMNLPSVQQFNLNTGSVEEILNKSLQIQVMSAKFLKEIRDAVVVSAEAEVSNNNTMPDMAVDLSRKNYDSMMI